MSKLGAKQLMSKFLEIYHAEDIQELQKHNHKTLLIIDYHELNSFFKAHYEKEFFDLSWQQILKYEEEKLEISLKIVDIPYTVLLKDLDSEHNHQFISTKGMIKNITPIQVGLKTAVYECKQCGRNHYIDIIGADSVKVPNVCVECGGKTFELLSDVSEYIDQRWVKLEEPLELRQGGTTREFKAYMEDYLASPHHNIKAGDVCNISGFFEIIKNTKTKEFEFIIKLHDIRPVESNFDEYITSEDDIDTIMDLANQPDIYKRLYETLAPHVYGFETIKKGILLQLFEGARPREDRYKSSEQDRWTIHILLVGDPGIGKSQLLTAINDIAPKTISISGAGTSEAGLTTTAVKDELTGSWAMEAGAVILADTGLLSIDEYDKLSQKTQKSLNEPMEQLKVSSAKAGLVQTMSARTSILAAANPKYSKWNKYESVKKQLNIPESNLSRFDLIFVLEDDIDETYDTSLAEALLDKDKLRVDPSVLIDNELFRKYVNYAKAECFPVLSDEAKEILVQFYVSTRQEAKENPDAKPITARDLKAIERLSVARAKVELRELVLASDTKEALHIYNEALASVGLNPVTAGELEGMFSNKELELVHSAETMIRMRINESPDKNINENVKRNILHELKVECVNGRYNAEDIYTMAYHNVITNQGYE